MWSQDFSGFQGNYISKEYKDDVRARNKKVTWLKWHRSLVTEEKKMVLQAPGLWIPDVNI